MLARRSGGGSCRRAANAADRAAQRLLPGMSSITQLLTTVPKLASSKGESVALANIADETGPRRGFGQRASSHRCLRLSAALCAIEAESHQPQQCPTRAASETLAHELTLHRRAKSHIRPCPFIPHSGDPRHFSSNNCSYASTVRASSKVHDRSRLEVAGPRGASITAPALRRRDRHDLAHARHRRPLGRRAGSLRPRRGAHEDLDLRHPERFGVVNRCDRDHVARGVKKSPYAPSRRPGRSISSYFFDHRLSVCKIVSPITALPSGRRNSSERQPFRMCGWR